MKNTTFLLVVLAGSWAAASGAEHGGHVEDHIPLEQIGWQAANLGILLIALFFFIKKSIVESFRARQQDYLARSEKTKAALKDAQAALAGIKAKLGELESGEKKSLDRAELEAQSIKAGLIKDAEIAADKIKKDATLVINNELNKAVAEINTIILSQAVNLATSELSGQNHAASAAREKMFVEQLKQVKA